MEINQSVMDMWNLMGIFMVSNAIYFAACAFLIWVGFRFTNNIYNSTKIRKPNPRNKNARKKHSHNFVNNQKTPIN